MNRGNVVSLVLLMSLVPVQSILACGFCNRHRGRSVQSGNSYQQSRQIQSGTYQVLSPQPVPQYRVMPPTIFYQPIEKVIIAPDRPTLAPRQPAERPPTFSPTQPIIQAEVDRTRVSKPLSLPASVPEAAPNLGIVSRPPEPSAAEQLQTPQKLIRQTQSNVNARTPREEQLSIYPTSISKPLALAAENLSKNERIPTATAVDLRTKAEAGFSRAETIAATVQESMLPAIESTKAEKLAREIYLLRSSLDPQAATVTR
ncbi:MAG: hypothetical protein KDB22_23865 [Planctomycetales bacterium]|nr:hypothetical protein [Planctomycetales bacterium]